ncbi:velvet factor-domain-containing protein [Phycomyces nitens]|nr:velvet factor-domain-containing protein [Phycomyces nitens]
MNNGPPPPLGLPRASRTDTRYRLVVVQNPIRARSCGFGEKDRRLIDPPPILQLFVEQDNGEIVRVSPSDSMFFLVQCDLYCENKIENCSVVYAPWSVPLSGTHPNTPQGKERETQSPGSMSGVISLRKPQFLRNLTGSINSNAYHLMNPNNEMGVYFIFHDLSVRTDGRFTLKFMLMNLAAGEPFTMSTSIQTEMYSDPFIVYSAKKFPGMTDSTELSRCFARQGIKISIRKETAYKRASDKYYTAPKAKKRAEGQRETDADNGGDPDNSCSPQPACIRRSMFSESAAPFVPTVSHIPFTRISIANVLSPIGDDD